MKVIVLYRPVSEHARSVETFMHDFTARNPSIDLQVVNVDDQEGITLAGLYDIMSFPAILVRAEDGSLLKYWNGDQLPLIDEVASYAFSR